MSPTLVGRPCKFHVVDHAQKITENNGQLSIIIHTTTKSLDSKIVINLKWLYSLVSIVIVKLLLLLSITRVCMENIAQGGVLRDKHSTRQSQVLYLSQDTSPSAVLIFVPSTG